MPRCTPLTWALTMTMCWTLMRRLNFHSREVKFSKWKAGRLSKPNSGKSLQMCGSSVHPRRKCWLGCQTPWPSGSLENNPRCGTITVFYRWLGLLIPWVSLRTPFENWKKMMVPTCSKHPMFWELRRLLVAMRTLRRQQLDDGQHSMDWFFDAQVKLSRRKCRSLTCWHQNSPDFQRFLMSWHVGLFLNIVFPRWLTPHERPAAALLSHKNTGLYFDELACHSSTWSWSWLMNHGQGADCLAHPAPCQRGGVTLFGKEPMRNEIGCDSCNLVVVWFIQMILKENVVHSDSLIGKRGRWRRRGWETLWLWPMLQHPVARLSYKWPNSKAWAGNWGSGFGASAQDWALGKG